MFLTFVRTYFNLKLSPTNDFMQNVNNAFLENKNI